MSIKRINEFPEGSGSLSGDDVFLFMDSPNGTGTTKQVSLNELINAIGIVSISGSSVDTGDITFSGSTISTLNSDQSMTLTTNGIGDIYIAADGSELVFKNGTIDLHNGGTQNAQILQFNTQNQQAVITGPTPDLDNNAQRLIIQGQRGSGNAEGGDVYLWGGDSDINGGDIKIYAGDADSNQSGYGGYVNIDGGNGYNQGGNVSITAGNSSEQGGNVTITAGYSPNISGNVYIRTGGGNKQWEFNNYGSLVFPNNTTLAVGTFDNGTYGNNGISLNCYVGYELNWQGGHLKSTQDNGISAANIYCDSAIEFPGSEIDNMEINSSGLIFPNNTVQTSAGIPSNTGLVPNSVSITNIVSISQANYDAIVTKDPNTLYIIS